MTLLSSMLSLVFAIGCGGPSESSAEGLQPTGCNDLACEQAWVEEAWPTQPEAVRVHIASQQDPLARALLVETVVERWPSTAGSLCRLLEPGVAQRRCDAIGERPHLWEIVPDDPASRLAFSGEAELLLALSPTARLPTANRVRPADCGPTVPERACRAQRAIEAARGADAVGARELWAGIEAGRWRDECHFEAVEHGCRRDMPQACAPVAPLCLSAGAFRTPCLVQVAGELAANAPASRVAEPAAWQPLLSAADGVQRELARVDPGLAGQVWGRILAEGLMLSFGRATVVTGDVVAVLPDAARPHLHAAAAWRATAMGLEGSLAERVAALQAALARTDPDPDAGPQALGKVRVAGLWPEDWPVGEDQQVIAYLQDARRLVSDDPEVDLAIVLLEAAARTGPPDLDLLDQGLGHDHPLVRATAERLRAQVGG